MPRPGRERAYVKRWKERRDKGRGGARGAERARLLQNVVKLWIVKRLYEFVLFAQASRSFPPSLALPFFSLARSRFSFSVILPLGKRLRSAPRESLAEQPRNTFPPPRVTVAQPRFMRYLETLPRNFYPESGEDAPRGRARSPRSEKRGPRDCFLSERLCLENLEIAKAARLGGKRLSGARACGALEKDRPGARH